MDNSIITARLGSDWEKLGVLMKDVLSTDVSLLDGINASLLAGSGKMLRPILTLYIARACNGGKLAEDSLRCAAAVEILHNATLLHDDVADAAATRRGTPTVYSEYGPVPAVLVGDYWLARAVALLVDSSDLGWMVKEFARTLTDLAEGEMLQQQKAFSSDTTVQDYLRIIYCKTASLFVTACESGARTVGASAEMMRAAGDFGRALGIAFQIRDDILDYAGGEATGKPVGLDIREQKITLPLLGALEGSGREKEIRQMINSVHEHPEYAAALEAFVQERAGVEYAEARLKEYVDAALQALEALPPSADRDVLAYIVGMNSERKK